MVTDLIVDLKNLKDLISIFESLSEGDKKVVFFSILNKEYGQRIFETLGKSFTERNSVLTQRVEGEGT